MLFNYVSNWNRFKGKLLLIRYVWIMFVGLERNLLGLLIGVGGVFGRGLGIWIMFNWLILLSRWLRRGGKVGKVGRGTQAGKEGKENKEEMMDYLWVVKFSYWNLYHQLEPLQNPTEFQFICRNSLYKDQIQKIQEKIQFLLKTARGINHKNRNKLNLKF